MQYINYLSSCLDHWCFFSAKEAQNKMAQIRADGGTAETVKERGSWTVFLIKIK